ncbi:MAG: D-glycero-beta-D-manno-heptose-7-phosphate kinase [Clostridia bacterium]|nr:D-glycero-beta-D-manno-heptose-7-phosphate kinase [Clostridia bacterium]
MGRSRLGEIIEKFNQQKILVIGDLIVDEYIHGRVTRISPEAPIPVLEIEKRSSRLGGACNVANNIRSLGGWAGVSGVVGNDRAGVNLLKMLEQANLCAEGVLVDPTRPTTRKTRVVAQGQQIVRMDSEKTHWVFPHIAEKILSHLQELMPQTAAVVISDYGKGVVSRELCTRLIAMAAEKRVPVVVDPKGKDYAKYLYATVVTPNIPEVETATGIKLGDNISVLTAGRKLLETVHGEAVLITRGPEGMTLLLRQGEPVSVPATGSEVFDVTGAGDTVTAVLALALAGGADYHQAMLLANYAAGAVVGKQGAATVTVQELLNELQVNENAQAG